MSSRDVARLGSSRHVIEGCSYVRLKYLLEPNIATSLDDIPT
jgi:hypothetical protein